MFCGKCGTDNPNDNKFCNKCGAPLGAPAGAQPMQNQPVMNQGYNPNMYQQPANKGNNTAVIVAAVSVFVSILVVMTCLILFVWKPFENDDKGDRSRNSGRDSGYSAASNRKSGDSSSSARESDYSGPGEKIESPAPAVEATAAPSYDQSMPADASVYSSNPEDIFYIFFQAFLYDDPNTVYDCYPPFDKLSLSECEMWTEQNSELKYDFGYSAMGYHTYTDSEYNDLIDRIYNETGYIANEIDEAAVVYTHYYLDEYEELDDEMIVIKISGRWYIYDLGDIDIYI